MSDSPMPVLMLPEEIIGMKRAEYLTGRNSRTVRKICLRHGIGLHLEPNAPWDISAPGLVLVMHGDLEGLEALRDGDRDHPRVRRAIDHASLVVPPIGSTLRTRS